MPGIPVEGRAHASKDFVIGKDNGSSEVAATVVGASPGPVPLARGTATPPNSELGGVHTPDPEVKVRRRRNRTRAYKLSLLGQTRGRKPRPEEAVQVEKLEKENRKLKEKICQFQLVIEAQKKISEILGIRQDNVPPMPDLEENE
jgi:hypothetical protein